jgi:pyruvate/2-oxoacid:ferredoxin oxidoreductase beta subunit
VENGEYKLNFDFPQLRPVTDYMKLQGRFRHLSPDNITKIQNRVNEKYEELKGKAVTEVAL